MKAVVAAFNQEKALVGAFSVIMNPRMDFFEALVDIVSIFAGLHLLIDLDSRGLPARIPAVFLHQAPEGECGEARPRLVLYRGEEFLADTDISILTSEAGLRLFMSIS